jgi:hypothetical protein
MIHSILFSGHLIDKPGRPIPRFPASKKDQAAAAITAALQRTLDRIGTYNSRGVAAAASGGDILFHEACLELHIPSEIWLGIPIEAFQKTSVAPAGPVWVSRYRTLISKLPVHILYPDATAPAPSTVWAEANRWMLDAALANGGDQMTLIALWDQKKGDGLGGTAHMVHVAEAHNARVEIIDVLSL